MGSLIVMAVSGAGVPVATAALPKLSPRPPPTPSRVEVVFHGQYSASAAGAIFHAVLEPLALARVSASCGMTDSISLSQYFILISVSFVVTRSVPAPTPTPIPNCPDMLSEPIGAAAGAGIMGCAAVSMAGAGA